jgi:hypothetical protein
MFLLPSLPEERRCVKRRLPRCARGLQGGSIGGSLGNAFIPGINPRGFPHLPL